MKCSKCEKNALRGKDLCLTCFLSEDAKATTKTRKHEEDDIQEAFFSAARIMFPKLGKLLFSVPNGGRRMKFEAARLKKQGATKGVSDIICLVPNDNYHFLCMETKTDDGRQSPDQIAFQESISMSGGLYVVFRSAEQGLNILQKYLKSSYIARCNGWVD